MSYYLPIWDFKKYIEPRRKSFSLWISIFLLCFYSFTRRPGAPGPLRQHHHRHQVGRPRAALQAAEVRLREGDRHVRLLQEARLLHHRVHLLAGGVPRLRARVHQAAGGGATESHRRWVPVLSFSFVPSGKSCLINVYFFMILKNLKSMKFLAIRLHCAM